MPGLQRKLGNGSQHRPADLLLPWGRKLPECTILQRDQASIFVGGLLYSAFRAARAFIRLASLAAAGLRRSILLSPPRLFDA